MSGFLDKLIESIPWLNRWLLREGQRLAVIEEGKDMPSAKLRSTVNVRFYREIEALAKQYINPGAVLKGTSDDTNSMDPAIDGHMVLLVPVCDTKPYRFSDIVAGDIVWFRRTLDGAENVLHRVIEKYSDHILTRGDNCVIPDGTIMKEDVKGICVAVMY